MSIAIEFGSGEFRSLRREGARLLARRASTDYLVINSEKAERRLLERSSDEFAKCEDGYLLFGSAATDLSSILCLPMQSALEEGKLRNDDPISRQFLGAIVDGLLPVPEKEEPRCIVIGGVDALSTQDSSQDSESFFERLVRLRGYKAEHISPGMGLILAECGTSGYSGVAIKLGDSEADVSIAYQTRELARFSIPRGAAHIDRQMAISANSYVRLQDGREALNIRPQRQWREQMKSIDRISDSRTLELRNQYRELIYLTLFRLRQELTAEILRHIPPRITLVIGGSLSEPAGVETLVRQALREVDLPVEIKTIQVARNARFAALRGGLIIDEIRSMDAKAAA